MRGKILHKATFHHLKMNDTGLEQSFKKLKVCLEQKTVKRQSWWNRVTINTSEYFT